MKSGTRNQFVAVFPVFLAAIVLGANYGWMIPTIKYSLNSKDADHLRLTSQQISCIVAAHEFCRLLGVLVTILVIDRVGRVRMLVMANMACFSGWLILCGSTHTIGVYICRILCGAAKGVYDAGVSLYIGEISSAANRGTFCTLTVVGFFVGMLHALILATYTPYTTAATATLAASSALLCSSYFLRESASYLIMSGKLTEAEANFRWFCASDYGDQTAKEFEKLKAALQMEARQKLTMMSLFKVPHYRKSLAVVAVLGLTVSMSGFWPLMSFISITFTSTNILGSNELSIVYAFLQLLMATSSTILINLFGRKSLLLMSMAVAILCHAVSAALFYTHYYVTPVPFFAWLTFATVTLYACVYSALIVQVVVVLTSEMFAQRMKALGCGVTALLRAFGSFCTSFIFLPISESVGMHCNFLFFCAVCLINFVWTYFTVIETRGKTLIEIQESLEKNG